MENARTYRTLLLGLDGSAAAQAALEHALLLARDLGAKLYMLHVFDSPAATGLDVLSLSLFTEQIAEEIGEEGKQALKTALARAKELGIDAEGLAASGRPGEQICRIAADKGADMIVIGATGKSNIEDMILGSVSEYVIDNAGRPVSVVRVKERR